MLEDSEDPVVKTVQPAIKTGKKWKVVEAVDQAKESLKIKAPAPQRISGTVGKRGRPHLSSLPKQTDHRACLELLQNRSLTERHNRALQKLAAIIGTVKGETTLPKTNALIFTTEGGAKS